MAVSRVILNIIAYIEFTRCVKSELVTIWFDNMEANNGWNISSEVVFGESDAGCFNATCCKMSPVDGVDQWILKSTYIPDYSSIQLQFDVSTQYHLSNDACTVFYSYTSSANKTQIKTIHADPLLSRDYYHSQIVDLPSPTSTTLSIWLYCVASEESNADHPCYWDNVYLKGMLAPRTLPPTSNVSVRPTDQPTIEPPFEPTSVPIVSTQPPAPELIAYDPTSQPTDGTQITMIGTDNYRKDIDSALKQTNERIIIIVAGCLFGIVCIYSMVKATQKNRKAKGSVVKETNANIAMDMMMDEDEQNNIQIDLIEAAKDEKRHNRTEIEATNENKQNDIEPDPENPPKATIGELSGDAYVQKEGELETRKSTIVKYVNHEEDGVDDVANEPVSYGDGNDTMETPGQPNAKLNVPKVNDGDIVNAINEMEPSEPTPAGLERVISLSDMVCSLT
eukprot:597395_1